MTIYITTADAARRMGVSQEAVRTLCGDGLLPGAIQDRRNGPWRIPEQAVTDWLSRQPSGVSTTPPAPPGPPSWWERFRYHPWIFSPTMTFVVLAAVVGLLGALISAGADLPVLTQQLREWGWIRDFEPAREGETLIIVATFNYTEGVMNTDAHTEIRRVIEQAKKN